MPKRRTLEQAEKQIASLVEENRKLAEELEELRRQDIALEGAASQAVSSRTAAEKEVIEFKTRLESAQKQVSELQQTSSALAAQVSRLTREVEKNPLNPLSVEEASLLFERVVNSFRTAKTLQVKQVTLNLKLATGKIADIPVLLLPDPKSVDPATLHELKLDLTSVAGAESTILSSPSSPSIGPGAVRGRKPGRKEGAGRARAK